MDQNPLPLFKPMPPFVSLAGDAPADNVPSDRPPLLTSVAGVTLNEVLDFVAADLTISTTQRRDRLCAMRRLALMVGKDPRLISARPDAMRVLFKSVVPAAHGIKETRWANIRSRVLAALAQAGIRVMRGRSTTRLSPAWLDFQAGLSTPTARIGLSRFMRFCTDKAFEPDRVDDAVFERFHQVLRTESPVARPHAVHRTACIQWNLAVPLVPALAAKVVTVSRNAQLYSLPWSDFPASFVADAEAFLNRSNSSSGPFTDEYVRPQRRTTIELRRGQIRQMASLLVASGYPTAEITGLAALADPVRARTILEAAHRRLGDGAQGLHGMALVLKVIGQHWSKLGPDAVAKLARYARQAAPKARGMTEKNRGRLRQFDSPQNIRTLLDLPRRIFRELKQKTCPDRVDALRAQQALAVEFLIVAPMRIANLTALDLTRHIVKTGRDASSVLHIVIPGEETKTGEPYEVTIPADTTVLLAAYRERYLPLISTEPTSLLFPNLSGCCRDDTAFSTALSAFLRRETGLLMNAHLFRHLAVTLYLRNHPEDLETARRILGHKSLATTMRFYAYIKNDASFRRYDEFIATQRTEAPRLKRERLT